MNRCGSSVREFKKKQGKEGRVYEGQREREGRRRIKERESVVGGEIR